MPYLFQTSVYAHETGIPVMRPMIMEFPDEMGVKNLDMQYMLGDSLLVAPVFSESGEVEYYLPEGTWTHLLSGEIRQGGKWYKDTYDYFSLPVYVRENSIFPVKEDVHVPDYDFRKGITIHLYRIADGAKVSTFVTDEKGIEKAEITAERKGNTITVSVPSEIEVKEVISHNDEKCDINLFHVN